MSFVFMMSSNFSRLHDASQSLFGSCSSVKQRNITVLRARLAGRVCSTAYKRFTAIRSAMLKRHVLTWTTWHPVLEAGMQRSPSGFEPPVIIVLAVRVIITSSSGLVPANSNKFQTHTSDTLVAQHCRACFDFSPGGVHRKARSSSLPHSPRPLHASLSGHPTQPLLRMVPV